MRTLFHLVVAPSSTAQVVTVRQTADGSYTADVTQLPTDSAPQLIVAGDAPSPTETSEPAAATTNTTVKAYRFETLPKPPATIIPEPTFADDALTFDGRRRATATEYVDDMLRKEDKQLTQREYKSMVLSVAQTATHKATRYAYNRETTNDGTSLYPVWILRDAYNTYTEGTR